MLEGWHGQGITGAPPAYGKVSRANETLFCGPPYTRPITPEGEPTTSPGLNSRPETQLFADNQETLCANSRQVIH